MIFRLELAEAIMRGEKTVTRRVPSPNPRSPWYRHGPKIREGKTYAVQPGRSKHGIGRIRVLSVELVVLGWLSEAEAEAEGFATRSAFNDTWVRIHRKYNTEQLVWKVEFEPMAVHAVHIERPTSAMAWDLRGEMVRRHRRKIRLVLTDRCDAVLPNEDDQRVIEGHVSRVSVTDAFAVVGGIHVPLDEVLALTTNVHHTEQSAPSRTVYDDDEEEHV